MSIEVATYVTDLQPVNPPSQDPRSQGDDHLRLIKQVLQNTFPDASKPIYAPKTLAKSANYSVVKADSGSIIYANTGGGSVTLTLPTLLAADAGWSVSVMKISTDTNPVFIAPPSGTLSSGQYTALAKARRCIPGIEFRVVWDGTTFMVARCTALPPGSMLDYDSATLPAGYEWPNGQTLASVATNYPEYNAAKGSGVTLDLRGRVAVTLDNLGGSSAGRLAGGIITGTVVGNVGGSDTRTLLTANLPPYTPTGSVSSSTVSSDPSTIAVQNPPQNPSNIVGVGGTNSGGSVVQPPHFTTTSTFTGTAQGGTSTAFGILQPSIMCSKILVVE